jgi:cytochrome P450
MGHAHYNGSVSDKTHHATSAVARWAMYPLTKHTGLALALAEADGATPAAIVTGRRTPSRTAVSSERSIETAVMMGESKRQAVAGSK